MVSIVTKKLTATDLPQFQELIRVFEEVFEMPPFEMPADGYLQQLLDKDDFLVFVALENNRVIGGMTAYELPQYYTQTSLLYIYDLAVKTQFQRQGVGKKLMEAIEEYGQATNMDEIFVQADLPDAHALEFYRSTGGLPEEVVHFTYPLKDQ